MAQILISVNNIDSNTLSYSSSNVGIITAIYDGVGIITVSVKNPGIETSTYDVRSSIIEFTQSGADDTYRFLRSGHLQVRKKCSA